ncbi:hypothetical protein A3J78_00825 [Candidatus Beckwithbacteria bacterium RBG_13_35_6]|uniref:SpoVT-AbrB domain-containing protein n=1 Tax=Candidatus Beckwithbacteria bacterium RBG_13_35_6 TaxID=1797456 RepID=A0A1F5DIG1_9BACT|nr:MAG: hypothetical protein A3J78_00825 [Candidatus Beckwithbacteria bacterium RBG_13_35_6]
MVQAMPTGEIVKLMDRGTITLPSKLRKKLNLKEGEYLNVFPWSGLLVVAPIDITAKITAKKQSLSADWNTDTPAEYLKKARYNSLEKLWAKRVKEGW